MPERHSPRRGAIVARAVASRPGAGTRAEHGAAADYDRRWAHYNERSLALLQPWIDGARPGRVLDVGCGTANLAPRLVAWADAVERYVGLDPSPGMLRAAGAKLTRLPFPAARVCSAAEALPFAPGTFDTAVSASSLHSWPDPAAGLREIRRVLRPGGLLMLLDWDRAPLPMRLLDGWMRLRGIRYRRMYAAQEIERMLRDAGLRIDARARGGAGGAWRLAGFRALVE